MTAAKITRRSGFRMGIFGGFLGLALSGMAAAAFADERPLVIARFLDLNSLDPHRASCDTCNIYLAATYETLVRLDTDDRTVVAGLAEKWEANGDNTKFTFHLNPKATFSDGSSVEAKDIKWSWDRLKNAQGGMAWLLDDVKAIELPDAHTVVVTLTRSNSEFLGKVIAPYMSVVNSDVATEHGAKSDAGAATDPAEPWFLENSAGTGPYVLEQYLPNDVLRLKRNDKYWSTPAPIGSVVIRQTKDAVAQAQALESGDADIATQIDADTAKTINSPDVVLKQVPSYNFLYMALAPGAKGINVQLTKEVREAIGYAIDYQGIVDFTTGGAGKLQPVPIPNGFPGTDGLPMPQHDLEKAKAVLAEAGHQDGFELEAKFPNLNSYGVDLSLLMQKVQQDLSKVNIKLNLQPLTFSQWLEVVNGDHTPVTASVYAPDYFGTDQYIQTFGMIEGTRWAKRSGMQELGQLNPKEGPLLEKALASPPEERDRLYHEIAKEIIGDRIIFPLVNPEVVLAHRKDVEGLRNATCCLIVLSELKFVQ